MYGAKAAGKAHYAFYEPAMDAAAHTRLQLTADLRRASFRGEFVLEYQPTVDLATGRPVGLEALIRWRHPQRGAVMPLDFVPLAEETGLIVPIGRWALAEACAQGAFWLRAFPSAPPLTMSVNLSVRQLHHGGLVEDVAAALRSSDYPAHLLTLELTESILVQGGDGVIGTLHALKALGVRLALDDFGTGYSSLSYLRNMPVDTLKVDRSFVEGADAGPEGESVLRGIVQLGQALGLVLVAEGIERASQAEALRALGCPLGQGFHFWKPLPANEIDQILGAQLGLQQAS
jgi:EAL domain-containing protein (putative c-di-GMP-specific phosphodiesterase class I)